MKFSLFISKRRDLDLHILYMKKNSKNLNFNKIYSFQSCSFKDIFYKIFVLHWSFEIVIESLKGTIVLLTNI